MMKTAVTVLQELMVKLGDTPEYECVTQTGPKHLAMFEYRCVARGATVTASARSKKEAKQEVARLMLHTLASRGMAVPPPYNAGAAAASSGPDCPPAAAPAPRSYVALLKELCEEYNLPAVDYDLVGDTGPPHLRHFTIKARVGLHERLATSTSKKAARQLAAEELYTYLRENLARVTRDFVEEDALVRAHEKAMDRYKELKEESVWRPDLGQRIADYHLDDTSRRLALDALEATRAQGAERGLAAVCGALGLAAEYAQLPRQDGGRLAVVQLRNTSPSLAMAGRDEEAAAIAALTYIRLALQN